MTKKKSGKMMLIISFILLVGMIIAVIIATYSWYVNQKSLSTVTWIKTPMVLTIGSGNNHDIKYLDMGDIDVESGKSKSYVFCVYGTPVDNYSLQLAYTTNIAFNYKVYRATIANSSKDADAVESTYQDEYGKTQTEYFIKISEKPVIDGLTLSQLKESKTDSVAKHQSHSLSYGDEYGLNAISPSAVQSNAEPLYWLAEENGTNVLTPLNTGETTADGTRYSLDYFIIEVSWDNDNGTVSNDKETDIVYLTASR
jgi:hypothetical protein